MTFPPRIAAATAWAASLCLIPPGPRDAVPRTLVSSGVSFIRSVPKRTGPGLRCPRVNRTGWGSWPSRSPLTSRPIRRPTSRHRRKAVRLGLAGSRRRACPQTPPLFRCGRALARAAVLTWLTSSLFFMSLSFDSSATHSVRATRSAFIRFAPWTSPPRRRACLRLKSCTFSVIHAVLLERYRGRYRKQCPGLVRRQFAERRDWIGQVKNRGAAKSRNQLPFGLRGKSSGRGCRRSPPRARPGDAQAVPDRRRVRKSPRNSWSFPTLLGPTMTTFCPSFTRAGMSSLSASDGGDDCLFRFSCTGRRSQRS